LAQQLLPGSFCGAIRNIEPTIFSPSLKAPMRPRKCLICSLNAGGYDFAVNPDLRADRAPVVWLPHLNPATVIVAPAPETFADARPISDLTPAFSRRAADGEHWLVDEGVDRLPITLIDGADTTRPAAIVIPLDSGFPTRIEAALVLWRTMMGHGRGRTPDVMTVQQRSRLSLILRGLDGRLAGRSYREIAEILFGLSSVPTGPDWRNNDLRSRTIRLCRRGRDLMHGGYVNLLCYPRQFRD
jgi:hypothetical protein